MDPQFLGTTSDLYVLGLLAVANPITGWGQSCISIKGNEEVVRQGAKEEPGRGIMEGECNDWYPGSAGGSCLEVLHISTLKAPCGKGR